MTNSKKANSSDQNPKNTLIGCGTIIVLILLIFAGCSMFGGDRDEKADTKQATASQTQEATTTANVAPGVDAKMGPQEWWNDYYKSKNCASQSMEYGGLPICMARSTDMANDNTMLVFYVDQDDPGVQEHFKEEARRGMFTRSLAEIVGTAKHDGDPRVQHVTDVRVIATGGKGAFSGWQDETKVQ